MSEHEKVTLYRPRGLFFWRPGVKYAEGHLSNGERHGPWVFWHANGNTQLQGEYIKGKKAATWTKWNENGARVTEGTFLYGKMHGTWTDWYANGQKAQESHWYMGKRDGRWTNWDSEGAKKKVETFDHQQELDRGYSIHTDLEIKELIRDAQRNALEHSWQRLVGQTVASLVKPWHIACWLLVFIVSFGLFQAKPAWRGVALSGIAALAVTSLISWTMDRRKEK